MGIKTIPLSRLEADPKRTLTECADSGSILVVELPDHRLVAIQPLDAVEDDDLTDELLGDRVFGGVPLIRQFACVEPWAV